MNKTLISIFGNSLSKEAYSFPQSAPTYITYGYHPLKFRYFDKAFLLVKPNSDDWTLNSIKKHLKTMEQLSGLTCVPNLPHMTALQRTNLIENRIPFVCGNGQIFLPFLGCYFENKINPPAIIPGSLSAASQLVFLHIFYEARKGTAELNLTKISGKLQISKATCTRAIKQLTALGLITARDSGTSKILSLNGSFKEVIKRALPYMNSPVRKTVYVKSLPSKAGYIKSGIKALSEISLIAAKDSDAGLAIPHSALKNIPKEDIISHEDFTDFGGHALQVWNYDPAHLTDSDRVDDLSLLLELNNYPDERVQKCLDDIRNKYDIEV